MDRLLWVSDYPLKGSSFGNVTLELARRIRNYKVYILSLSYSGMPIAPFPGLDVLPLTSISQLDYYFRKFKPKKTVIFHSFYFLEQLAGLSLPPNLYGYIPIEGENLPSNLLSFLMNFDRLIVPSKYSQKVLKKKGLKAEVVYHGVDTTHFTPAIRPSLKEFRWGYIGQNDIRKQVPRIMQAYSRLPKKTRGSLALATPNKGHYNLTALAQSYRISPIWIEKKYHGIPLSRQNVLEFYHSLNCYVNCATESFGLPSLEAAACGLPNIALEHGGNKEVLGGAALYVKVKDMLDTSAGTIGMADRDDLYQKMKIILEVAPERKRLIKEAKRRVKRFTWEKSVAKFLDVIEG